MKKLNLFLIAVSTMVLFHACGGAEAPAEKAATETTITEVVELDPKAQIMARGEAIYKEKCIVCHQANGEGILHAFPPLKDADYLLADKIRAVKQVLNGAPGGSVVNGIQYNAPMPPQVDNHKDAVAVVNYILNSWGNDGGWVEMDEVQDIEIGPRW
jgi:mono/diheme cytochrome c family protein